MNSQVLCCSEVACQPVAVYSEGSASPEDSVGLKRHDRRRSWLGVLVTGFVCLLSVVLSSSVSAGNAAAAHGEDDVPLQQWMRWYEGLHGGLAQDGVLQWVETGLQGSATGLTGLPADDMDMVRRLRLQALLRPGHLHEAVRVFASWPPEEGRRVLHYRWHGDKRPFYWKFLDSEDVILGLATAYALAGQPADAQALLASSKLEGHGSALARGLNHWLQTPESDPFDLLVALTDESSLEEPRGMFLRLLIALADREGYASFVHHGTRLWQVLLDMERRQLTNESGPLGLAAQLPTTRDGALGRLDELQGELDRLRQTVPTRALPDPASPDIKSLRRQFNYLAEAEFELFVLDRTATRALAIYNRRDTRGTMRLARDGDDWKETSSSVTFGCNFPTQTDTTD